jgi:hypothetical protein
MLRHSLWIFSKKHRKYLWVCIVSCAWTYLHALTYGRNLTIQKIKSDKWGLLWKNNHKLMLLGTFSLKTAKVLHKRNHWTMVIGYARRIQHKNVSCSQTFHPTWCVGEVLIHCSLPEFHIHLRQLHLLHHEALFYMMWKMF